ncbi:10 TM acyl transferase domain found in Cas1p-domain-containing protein [Mycena metata]|uniref:10 TM acyl transferase domain found in Cas1p-domain-containing protein n=1 Tax=Mycena metata TaxID=1033252 RepID=A0AAD7KJD7_9AGAR|nr:10 TM acyl transferase domain found in Cas1p-domain-containing protein [Mycena metata]
MYLHWRWAAGFFSLVISLLGVLTRYALLDRFDPLHCAALLHQGAWLDRSRTVWQPNGCMLHNYTPQDGFTCLESRELIFIGDSTTRGLFFQFGKLLDPALNLPVGAENKHQDQSLLTASQIRLLFYWDPFLNSSHIQRLAASRGVGDGSRPALLVIGAGLWYLRYADGSGGLAAYESRIETILDALIEGNSVADEVVILPVEGIISSKLSVERARSMHHSDVDAMNSDLLHRIKPLTGKYLSLFQTPSRPLPVSLPPVFNQMLDPSQTEDGLHFSDSVVRTQANILLNFRCNDHLPKTPPMNKTCCRKYPAPSIVQLLILVAVMLWVIYTICVRRQGQWTLQREQRSALAIGVSIALIYAADRTGLWLKEHKNYTPEAFAGLCLAALVVGLGTVKRGEKDLGFLNREQTDEWKGWMQVVILIYHYMGASQVAGIYNPVRVLVAGYLFMTGYGHTTFYLLKADHGFTRVAQVLIRLNLFTLLLAYTMATDYLFYYFAPLVSLWFCVVYLTMAIGSRFNDRSAILVCKIFSSAIIVGAFMKHSWILETLFSVLRQVFRINWSAREWAFRVNLDLYIVYVGQLTALGVIKVRKHRLMEHRYWALSQKLAIGVSTSVFIWFFSFELSQESKFTYNTWHPWISWLPVLAFVVLRNANSTLRASSSRAFAFIGTCSLETFIIQSHFFLAADSKGVLVVIPGVNWRPFNFIITWTAFVFISHLVAEASADLTQRLCAATSPTLPLPVSVPLQSLNQPAQDEVGDKRAGHSRFGLKSKLGVVAGLMWIANMFWKSD